jgi:hypothetical protein
LFRKAYEVANLPDRALVIKPNWLDLILAGKKSWELRGTSTRIRGNIALAASGTGLLYGTIKISNCLGPFDTRELKTHFQDHKVCDDLLDRINYRATYAWVLSDPQKFAVPMPYKHPTGAVIWVKLS